MITIEKERARIRRFEKASPWRRFFCSWAGARAAPAVAVFNFFLPGKPESATIFTITN